MWLVFQARKTEPNEQNVVKESAEIPVPANLIGAKMTPQKDNPTHVSIHQDLLQSLQTEGWELLPDHGGMWWERRFRR